METRFVHSSTPIPVQKSRRMDTTVALTSGNAGKVIPLAYYPLLREDSVRSGRLRVTVEMGETAEVLLNAVNLTVKAYLVPYLAFPRFNGMDQLNRSYMKQPETDGGAVQPFIEQLTMGSVGSNPILKSLGLHLRQGQLYNSAILEAYNAIWNFRARNRSQGIAERASDDFSLAPAFWAHNFFKHVVPDFDQALIDGEVPLTLVDGAFLPVRGLGFANGAPPTAIAGQTMRETASNAQPDGIAVYEFSSDGQTTQRNPIVRLDSAAASALPMVYAEMNANGVSVSLANIDLAKKTAAFARLKAQYQGIDDDYIVDLLMSGVRIPAQDMKNPILMGSQTVQFGYSQRFATDSGALTEKVASGIAGLEMRLRLPPINTGGIVMVTAEITPEQVFERQRDYFLTTVDQDKWPEYLRDFLDPEKVEVVPNEAVDIDHATPNDTFGYAPLNYQWQRTAPRIGGKYFRPEVEEPTNEDRMKVWTVETANPTLTQDFYLCTNMHHKVFADQTGDHFDITTKGMVEIVGNTVFGAILPEAGDLYDEVLAEAPLDTIDKPDGGVTGVTETETAAAPAKAKKEVKSDETV